MIQSLKSSEIDVAIGLTEGWIAGIKGSAQADWYKVVGKYVETPLCMYNLFSITHPTYIFNFHHGFPQRNCE